MIGARPVAAVAAIAIAGCGGDDPCADAAGACVAIRFDSSTADVIDLLELDLTYAELHATTTTEPADGGSVRLPLATAIVIVGVGVPPIPVGVVAAGKLDGAMVGVGAGSVTITVDGPADLDIELGPVGACVADDLYCGGGGTVAGDADALPGDPDTLYRCVVDGVPRARGRCVFGCITSPTADDTCRGGGGTCIDGGFYCGGDKLDGDPSTLYTCAGGVGTAPVACANGCVINPGDDDACR